MWPADRWRATLDAVTEECGAAWYIAMPDGWDLDLGYLSVFDSVVPYMDRYYKDDHLLKSYARVAERVRSAGKPSIATVIGGGSHVRKLGFDIDRSGGKYIRQRFDLAQRIKADWVAITSWNEWFESNQIEPSREYGFEGIKYTRELSAAFKGVRLAPLEGAALSFACRQSGSTKEITVTNTGRQNVYFVTCRKGQAIRSRIAYVLHPGEHETVPVEGAGDEGMGYLADGSEVRALKQKNARDIGDASILPVVAKGYPARNNIHGSLAVYARNPHDFQDAKGRPVVLIGDYTWGTFSDVEYDYRAMFDTLKACGLNFARAWVWWGNETGFDQVPPQNYHRVNIVPFQRTGPGSANDGRPKYDLTRFNPAFFKRLQDVCRAARQRGIFLQLTLMDAWMIKHPHLWKLHACHRDNNVNGVDGDPKETGRGTDGEKGFCSMGNPKVLEVQKAFIRKVLDAVNRFDNILFEIANENYYNPEWEKHLCEFIHQYEKDKPKHHLAMPLDLPNHDYGGIKTWDLEALHANLLKARALSQPLIFDTDGIGSPEDAVIRKAAWTAFVSGGHVDYLDDSLQPGSGFHGDYKGSRRAALRQQLGYLARFTKQVRFWEMQPDDALVKEGHAFAMASSKELVAYLPDGGSVTLITDRLEDRLIARWLNPLTGTWLDAGAAAGTPHRFTASDNNDWVLYIKAARR